MHKKTDALLVWGFTAVLALFCLFLVWFVPTRAGLDFQLADIDKSLETSYGRERKQQYEFDQVTAELPLVRAELAETQPLADAAEETDAALKAERRALRAEKAELEAQLEEAGQTEPQSPPEEAGQAEQKSSPEEAGQAEPESPPEEAGQQSAPDAEKTEGGAGT